MQDLQLIGVHEDGEHLLLSGDDGARFRMPLDEPLRAALRRERPRLGQLQIEIDAGLRPRDVQSLIRAGVSAQEVAERAGWSVEKVHRYEGPILAEREHVAGLARTARLRARAGVYGGGNAPTLSARVAERLKGRGVTATDATWDAWRADDGPWTVVLTFAAGGRQRQASWSFDLADRALSAVDDEARWLSEEVQPPKGPIPAPHLASPAARATKVYDVEAEGGLRPAGRAEDQDEPIDLMTAMRERSTARGRRQAGGRRGSPKAPNNVPGAGDHAPDQALPLEDLAYDPDSMPPPPGAHADPDPSGLDGQAEPDAAAVPIRPTEPTQPADIGLVAEVSSPHETRQATEGTDEPVATLARNVEPVEPVESKTRATPSAPRKAARKGRRPGVPAWDDIMFGSKPGSDRSSS